MIDATTKERWDDLYDMARFRVASNPRMYEKLNKVYQDPSYYSKWYLLTMEGNLNQNGSVPSEINYSNLQSHLGNKNQFSLPENILQLFLRYEAQIGQKLNKEMVRKTKRFMYRGTEYTGPRRQDCVSAYKSLSDFAFSKFSSNMGWHLQSVVDEDDYTHVWKSTTDWDDREECNNYVIYTDGDRCNCQNRVSFQLQCPHELIADGCFILDKWHHRWYNQETYQKNSQIIGCQTYANFTGSKRWKMNTSIK